MGSEHGHIRKTITVREKETDHDHPLFARSGQTPLRANTALTLAALSLLLIAFVPSASAQTTNFSLPLTTASTNKMDLGSFIAGTTLKLALIGNADLGSSELQVVPNGSLFVPAKGVYSYANAGAIYPTASGGDGINHFPAGGLNYDTQGNAIFGFVGKKTTDTTDPATIRFGAVVGTFNSSPNRNDWFYVGYGGSFVVPAGGGDLFLAVNDSFPTNNHGAYSGTLSAVPEASSVVSFGLMLALGLGGVANAQRRKASASVK